MNSTILIGRCSRDPELRFIPQSGVAVTKLSLAVDKDLSKEKKEQAISQGKQTADFINITVFGKAAENCANFLQKGSKCAVQGRISTGNYTKDDGTKVYTTEVIADKVEFLEPKGQAKPQDEDVFTPTDENPFDNDSDMIPF